MDVKLLRGLGGLAEQQGQYDVATGYFEKAVEIPPVDPDLRIDLGNLYQITKQYRKAIPQFELVLSENPKNLDALLGAAKSYEALGNTAIALEYYKQALHVNPNVPEVRAAIMRLSNGTGASSEAAENARQ